uniref:CHK kinase-like domain-containing protein n=1 Tax=Heliothis virescens TaxID=7102 RepID=A0A2A4JSU1_HELVI
MVGEASRRISLENILSEKQVHHVVKQCVGADTWQLQACHVRAATDGLAGFLGQHLRATLQVAVDGHRKDIHLFIKCIPMNNGPKAEFIDSNNYFKREKYMFKLLEEIRDEKDPYPWCPKAYIYTDSMIVMPDLAVEGYTTRHYTETLDLPHMMLGAATLARFHAAFTNYETRQSIINNSPYNSNDVCGNLLSESTFCDSPFMRACAKVAANVLKVFSTKSYSMLPNLEEKLTEQFLVGCEGVKEWEGTLNVLIHKDLWVNNMMFKYEDNVPTNALILDFQLLRYAPPAFDLMSFVYLTTSRSFREKYEKQICDNYFTVFCANLDEDSKRRIKDLGYNRENFWLWCERARMFGLVEPAAIHPFILMDPKTAQKTFDDPETYDRVINEDRSEPVVQYASSCSAYRDRLLEVFEEFVDRYVINQL